jgi:hypothetical protein
MAVKKTVEYKGTHDVSTHLGFLATYDELAQLFNGVHHWCDSGMRYPYEATKDAKTGEQLIVRPDQRQKISDGFAGDLADEDLTDSGKAKVAALRSAGLDKARRGAYLAMKYGLENEYLTPDEMKTACKALGIPELVKDGGHNGTAYVYFRTPAQLTTEQRAALTGALGAAALTAGIDGLVVRDGGSVESDRYAANAWLVPADATAGK